MLEGLGKLEWISEPTREARHIVRTIRSHSFPQQKFRMYSSLHLKLPNITHFATMIVLLQRFLRLRVKIKKSLKMIPPESGVRIMA
jgi:hypothetical protein